MQSRRAVCPEERYQELNVRFGSKAERLGFVETGFFSQTLTPLLDHAAAP